MEEKYFYIQPETARGLLAQMKEMKEIGRASCRERV